MSGRVAKARVAAEVRETPSQPLARSGIRPDPLPAGTVFFACFGAFLVLASFAGAWSSLVWTLTLAAVAIVLIIVSMRGGLTVATLPLPLVIAMVLLFAYPLVQLIPLPFALWRHLPAHEEYAFIEERFAGLANARAWHAISIRPAATEQGWYALMPAFAAAVAVLRLRVDHVRHVLLAMILLACTQVAVMAGQMVATPSSGGRNVVMSWAQAAGTFEDPHALAGWLAMTLPVGVALWAFAGRGRRRVRSGAWQGGSATRLALRRTGILLPLAVGLGGLLATRSRVGIATAVVGLACSALILGYPRTRRSNSVAVPMLIAAGCVLALMIGVAPLPQRLESAPASLSLAARGTLLLTTLRAALDHLPLGSGHATFPDVMARYLSGSLGGEFRHAHNDYLEMVLELGLVGLLVTGLFLFAWITRMRTLLRAEAARSFAVLQIGAGLALVPVLLQAVFAAPLHVPEIALWLGVLAAVLWHPGPGSSGQEGFDTAMEAPSARAGRRDGPAA